MKYLKLFEQDFDDPFGEEMMSFKDYVMELVERNKNGEKLTSREKLKVHNYLYDNDYVYKKDWDDNVKKLLHSNYNSNIDLHENLSEMDDDPFGEDTIDDPIILIKKHNRGEKLNDEEMYKVHKYLYKNNDKYRKEWEDSVDRLFNKSNYEYLSESIKFVKQTKKKDAKTDVYNVTKSGTVIGQVKWSSRMRGYAFLPTTDCDVEVKEFVKDLMAKRRAEKKKSK